MRVIARLRPPKNQEEQRASPQRDCWIQSSEDAQSIIVKTKARVYAFQFDHVYDTGVKQEQLCDEEVMPLVSAALQGEQVTLIAFGQTGSGKRFFVEGVKQNIGALPYAIETVFKYVADHSASTEMFVTISWFEVFQEQLHDLFSPAGTGGGKGLRIVDHAKRGVVVAGLSELPVISISQTFQLINGVNLDYERHNTTVFELRIEQRPKPPASTSNAASSTITSADNTTMSPNSVVKHVPVPSPVKTRTTGSIRFVVMQGSDTPAVNGGETAPQVFAQVLRALQARQPRVPFSKSKVTSVLKPALIHTVSGPSDRFRTTLLVTISPDEVDLKHTLESLNVGASARAARLHATKKQTGRRKSTTSTSTPTPAATPVSTTPMAVQTTTDITAPETINSESDSNPLSDDTEATPYDSKERLALMLLAERTNRRAAEQRLADLESQLKNVTTDRLDVGSELSKALARARDAEQRLAALETRAREWLSERDQMRKELDALATALRQAAAPPEKEKPPKGTPPTANTGSHYKTATKKAKEFDIYKDVVDSSIARLRGELEAAEKAKAAFEKQLRVKDTTLRKLQKEIESLTRDLRAEREAHSLKDGEIRSLRERQTRLEQQLREAEQWRDQTLSNIREMASEHSTWEEAASEELAHNKRELADARKLITELEGALSKRDVDIAVLTEQVVALGGQLTALQEREKQWNDERRRLEGEISAANSEQTKTKKTTQPKLEPSNAAPTTISVGHTAVAADTNRDRELRKEMDKTNALVLAEATIAQLKKQLAEAQSLLQTMEVERIQRGESARKSPPTKLAASIEPRESYIQAQRLSTSYGPAASTATAQQLKKELEAKTRENFENQEIIGQLKGEVGMMREEMARMRQEMERLQKDVAPPKDIKPFSLNSSTSMFSLLRPTREVVFGSMEERKNDQDPIIIGQPRPSTLGSSPPTLLASGSGANRRLGDSHPATPSLWQSKG